MFKIVSMPTVQKSIVLEVKEIIPIIQEALATEKDPTLKETYEKFLSEISRPQASPGFLKLTNPISRQVVKFYNSKPDELLRGGCEVCCFLCCGRPPSMQIHPTPSDPVQDAMMSALLEDNVSKLQEVVQKYGRPLIVAKRIGYNADTALHLAKSAEMVRHLCGLGIDVNSRNLWGQTPMHTAATGSVVQALVSFGGNVNERTVLIANDRTDVAVSVRTTGDRFVFYRNGNTPLHYATTPDVVTKLLDLGADVNLKNDPIVSILHDARNPNIPKVMIHANPDRHGEAVPGFSAFKALLNAVSEMGTISTMKPLLLRSFNQLNDVTKTEIQTDDYSPYVIAIVPVQFLLNVTPANTIKGHTPQERIEFLKFLKQDLGVSFTQKILDRFDARVSELRHSWPEQAAVRAELVRLVV